MKGLPALFGAMVFLLCCTIILGVIIESGREDHRDTTLEEPTGTINLNAVFSPAKKRDFFIKNQQYQSKCNAYEEKIRRNEDGFELAKYRRYPIYNMGRDNRYEHKIYQQKDGSYEMRVNITCIYDVTVRLNLFAYGTETLEYDGGNVYFNMDIYQNKDTGRYHLVSMDAYKHSIN